MSIDTQPTPETLAAFWLDATFAATDDEDADDERHAVGFIATTHDPDDARDRILAVAARVLLAAADGADATALAAILAPMRRDLEDLTRHELHMLYTSERLIRSALAT